MAEDGAAASASEPITTVTGGNKPVHRFLRGQPKIIGVVLVMMAVCMFMFGIPMTLHTHTMTSADVLSPFWLGILLFISGLLYVLSERSPSKKMITASLAMSIISTIGVLSACVDFIKSIFDIEQTYWFNEPGNLTDIEVIYMRQHYNELEAMECMFLCHSIIGGVLLIIMTCFARAGLRSSNTQAIVVMRNLPSVD